MAQYLKRSRLGGFSITEHDFSNPETEAIALFREDYRRFIVLKEREAGQKKEILALQGELAEAKKEADKAYHKGLSRAEDILSQFDANCEKIGELEEKIRQWQEAYKRKEQETDCYQTLNENLLRIHRERSNAERKMSPKAQRSGYRVLSTEEYLYRYRVQDCNYRMVSCDELIWKTDIESPYAADIAPQLAKECMEKDLIEADDAGNWRLGELGISAVSKLGETIEDSYRHVGRRRYHYGDLLQEIKKEEEKRKARNEETEDHFLENNILLDYQVKLNAKNGYWEIALFHTKPLTEIGEDWQYHKKKKDS